MLCHPAPPLCYFLLIGTVGNSSCLCGFFLLGHSRFFSRDPRKKYPSDAFLLLQNSLEAELEFSVFSSFFCSLNATENMHVEIVTLNANSTCNISGWVFEKQKIKSPLWKTKS